MAAYLHRGPLFRRSIFLAAVTQCSLRTFSRAISGDFEKAIELLETLQSNKLVVKTLSTNPQDANAVAIPEMLGLLRKVGYSPEDFTNRIKFIHVSGTKGKGSVCAMVQSILLQYRGISSGSQKGLLGPIGLYTSPHLTTVRERIRLDGIPVSKQMFAQYFFDLWDKFSTTDGDHELRPSYFRYLTILALHIFMQEGVETAIMECGIGGEYDSTNILSQGSVTVTGVTRLGIDHVGMLGHTVEEIAWHKAGIMKGGVPAFTVKQLPNVQYVLERRAAEKGVNLAVVEPSSALEKVKLGLGGDFQKENAALAASLAACHLRRLGISGNVPEHGLTSPETLPGNFVAGLQTVEWPGRCQILKEGNLTWFLDGAHTSDSIRAAATWFRGHLAQAQKEPNPPSATMLIFNQEDRDGLVLLRDLLNSLYKPGPVQTLGLIYPRGSTFARPLQRLGTAVFTYAAFPTNIPFMASTGTRNASIKAQERLASAYQNLDGNPLHMSYATIEEAVQLAKRVSAGTERVLVLVTGSLYLVGGVLQILAKASNTVDISSN
jgi:folylpolyglutamate synthase